MPVRKNKLNRGQVLKAAVKSSHFKIKDVAKRAGYSRAAYYTHIEDPDLDYHILMAYGKAIMHDFTEEFPDMPKYFNIASDPLEHYNNNKPQTLEEALMELEFLREKYMELLEKFNQMILEKMNAGK